MCKAVAVDQPSSLVRNTRTSTRMQPTHQRARGALELAFKRRGAATVLDRLWQEGCLKARFPTAELPAWPGAVTLNTAGGVAGGDRLSTYIRAGEGTAVTVASQAAERVYRALPGAEAEIATRIEVGAGAALEWLPQETILFDACAVRRRLDIELAPGASVLAVESLVFGRTAMGEEVRSARFRDWLTVRREGRLVWHDAIRLVGPVATVLDRGAVGRGARAVATIVQVGPEAAGRLEELREGLVGFETGLEAGASVIDGVLVVRMVAPTGAVLRRGVIAGLNILRPGRTVPRVWTC